MTGNTIDRDDRRTVYKVLPLLAKIYVIILALIIKVGKIGTT